MKRRVDPQKDHSSRVHRDVTVSILNPATIRIGDLFILMIFFLQSKKDVTIKNNKEKKTDSTIY